MRKLILACFSLSILALTSCTNPENKAKSFVDNFYSDVYNNGADKYGGSLKKSREIFNYSYFSSEMEQLIRNNYLEAPDKGEYKLTAERKSDNTILISSTGTRKGSIGNSVNVYNQFLVTNINNEWKITDTNNVITFDINFEIVDSKWEPSWDIQKSKIIQEIIDNLKLEIISEAYQTYFRNAVKGDLRLVNNSNYDVKNIEILIEHFDNDGVSVNASNDLLTDIIRSKGYREFDWYTSDCAKCISQKFIIKFLKEPFK